MTEKTITNSPLLLLPQPGARRRGGRPPLDADRRASARIGVACTEAEAAQVRTAAKAAGLSCSAFLLSAALSRPIPKQNISADARQIWSSSSRLQSDFNQVCARLNEARLLGDSPDGEMLHRLLGLYSGLYELIVDLRLSLMSAR